MEAPNTALVIKGWITALVAFGSALWGMTGWMIIILLACILLDYATGTWAALKSGTWSSSYARQGLWHKLGEIVALAVAALCDIALRVILASTVSEFLNGLKLPGAAFTLLVSIWYIFTELGSIIENAGKLGAPIPSWLATAIAQIRKKADTTARGSSDAETGEESPQG